MNINIIVSVSENWVIGDKNKLLWKQSDDLKRFKKITSNNPVIMGQRTFESLPNGALPNRENIVLTDNEKFSAPNITTAYNVNDALYKAKECCEKSNIFIIGGGMIYRQFLDYADTIYLTVVHTTLNGDTTFPVFDDKKWKLVSEEFKNKDDKNEYDVTYKIYKK